MDVEACLLHELDKFHEIIVSLKVVLKQNKANLIRIKPIFTFISSLNNEKKNDGLVLLLCQVKARGHSRKHKSE